MKKLREYPTYEDYIKHQKEKTSNPKVIQKLQAKHDKRVKTFVQHFVNIHLFPNSKILCLGARTGDEIDAWEQLGHCAIGVDLIPHHPKVIVGDFHKLIFEDESFDLVYSNSIDHSTMPEVFLAEATRVLKINGLLIIEIHPGIDGKYEELSIRNQSDIINIAPKNLKYIGCDEPKKLYKVKEYQLIFRKQEVYLGR